MKLFFIVALTVLFISCATAPKASVLGELGEDLELSLLPAGGRIYLWTDAVKGRPLLDVFSSSYLSGRNAVRILDSTTAAAGVFFAEGQGRRFFLAASGNYPRFRANLSLGFSKGWKKQKSPAGSSYWYSQNDKVAVALGSSLALVSDADPWEISSVSSPREIPPAAFTEFRRPMALAGWITSPSEYINGFLDSLGISRALGIPLQIPAQDFFFGATRLPADSGSAGEDAPWELIFKIKAASAAQARSLLGLFSAVRFFYQRGGPVEFADGAPMRDPVKAPMNPQEAAALLFANAPEQDGEFLVLRVSPLDGNRIALLFDMFSVYSTKL